jgi:hypothetical protein
MPQVSKGDQPLVEPECPRQQPVCWPTAAGLSRRSRETLCSRTSILDRQPVDHDLEERPRAPNGSWLARPRVRGPEKVVSMES